MAKVRFTILNHGLLEGDLARNVALANPGTRSNHNPAAIWGRIPMYSVLVQHEDLGWLLFDTGFNAEDLGGKRPLDPWFEIFPCLSTEEDHLENRLKQLGLTAHDIDMVVVSHTHWDHIGGVDIFSGTKAGEAVVVPGRDYAHGLVQSHSTPDPIGGGYFKWNYDVPGLTYRFVDEDCRINDEIELIALEGHTPCVLGLMVHLASGTYIFPSDAVPMALCYGPPVRDLGLMYDSLGYRRTIEKLKGLERKHEAKVFFSHDIGQFETYKLAPAFYE
jgi:glyoxylase-like metal-dependent hydrolase (beta-lactamase superfamily II)